MKVEVEYDATRQTWYVWEAHPWWMFKRNRLICSGESREYALKIAQSRIERGLLSHSEYVNL